MDKIQMVGLFYRTGVLQLYSDENAFQTLHICREQLFVFSWV